MRLSHTIDELQKLKDRYGDLELVVDTSGIGDYQPARLDTNTMEGSWTVSPCGRHLLTPSRYTHPEEHATHAEAVLLTDKPRALGEGA